MGSKMYNFGHREPTQNNPGQLTGWGMNILAAEILMYKINDRLRTGRERGSFTKGNSNTERNLKYTAKLFA